MVFAVSHIGLSMLALNGGDKGVGACNVAWGGKEVKPPAWWKIEVAKRKKPSAQEKKDCKGREHKAQGGAWGTTGLRRDDTQGVLMVYHQLRGKANRGSLRYLDDSHKLNELRWLMSVACLQE